MRKLEDQYQPHYGIVKIIPPASWKPRSTSYEQSLQNLVIKNPISQEAHGKGGIYEFQHITLQSIPYNNFVRQSNANQPQNKSLEEIEQLFWKSIVSIPPIYGADLTATLMDQTAGGWNLDKLMTILQKAFNTKLRGVNSSYCYIGSWRSLFCWHKEDLDLSAINYLHFGKPKIWYSIQPDEGFILQKQAKRCYSNSFSRCKQYLRHKTILMNPYLLKKSHPNLKISKAEQKQGQFIIAFNNAYHCGFNSGVNVAEAVNFATFRWISLLKNIEYCLCRKSSIKSSYQLIMRQFEKSPEIMNSPQFLAATQEIMYEQEQFKSSKQIKRTKIIEKTPRKTKKVSRKIKQKLTKYVQCDSCKKWRIIPENSKKNYKNQDFVCSMLHKQCRQLISSQKDDK